jgi:polar amino acid transport system permease protein
MSDYLGLLAWGAEGWGDQLAQGTWLTIRLALATLPFGLVLGFLVALARNSATSLVLRPLGDAFTTVFRGLPELLTLFIVYYGGQILFQRVVGLFTDTYIELSGFVAGMIALGVVFAAFASEVFLGALRAIPKGQGEAARALGLSRFHTMCFVTFPQLWRYALPGIANLWLVLLKDTALVSVIALNDLLRMTNIAVGATREPFFFYFVACMIYLTLSLISSVGIVGVERWANKGERRTA